MVLDAVGVTGATGVLGRQIVSELSTRATRVVSTSRRQSESTAAWDLSVWKSHSELDELFAGCSAIIHAGAVVPSGGVSDARELFDANVRSCLCIAEWALLRAIPVVYVSGAVVYADPHSKELPETAPLSDGAGFGAMYGCTKVLGEAIFRRYEADGLRLAVVRPSSIYGPGQLTPKLVPRFLEIAAGGGDIFVQPPSSESINLIHAADVARAIAGIVELGAWTTFNIAAATSSTIAEIAEACVRVSGRGRVVRAEDDTHPGRTRFQLDTRKARLELHFEPAISLDEGLATMLQSPLRKVSTSRTGIENQPSMPPLGTEK